MRNSLRFSYMRLSTGAVLSVVGGLLFAVGLLILTMWQERQLAQAAQADLIAEQVLMFGHDDLRPPLRCQIVPPRHWVRCG